MFVLASAAKQPYLLSHAMLMRLLRGARKDKRLEKQRVTTF
jgi:hypothetical protein